LSYATTAAIIWAIYATTTRAIPSFFPSSSSSSSSSAALSFFFLFLFGTMNYLT
jgi:hypothetical protein